MQGTQITKKPAIDSPIPSPTASPVQTGGDCGSGISDCGLRKFASRKSQSAIRLGRRAFTLTELLVVIAIIGVLASLITAAAVNALKNSKRARIVLEIKNMSGALENFKTTYNAYPPNGMHDGTTANLVQRLNSDFERMAKKAFPRINPAELEVFSALADAPYNTSIVTDSTVVNGLATTEALYFWLGGFSSDPQYPLSGPGGPSFLAADVEVLENRQNGYEFNLGRLGPRDEDDELDYGNVRYVEYTITVNGAIQNRRINLWTFSPDGSERPYVYFDASRYKPYQYDVATIDASDPEGNWIYPFLQYRQGAPANSTDPDDLVFVNQKKFQIIHAGLDDAWGSCYVGSVTSAPPVFHNLNPPTPIAPADWLLFPTGPFTEDISDTLSNFTDGALADSQE